MFCSFFTENLTQVGHASLSSNGGGPAINAIEPPISNKFGLGICTHTFLGKPDAWWMFEFNKETVFITDVIIYYREDCKYMYTKKTIHNFIWPAWYSLSKSYSKFTFK